MGTQATLLITGILSARLLGADGRGELATAMLVPTLAAFLSGLAVSQVLTVVLAAGSQARRSIAQGLKVVILPACLASISCYPILHSMLGSRGIAITAAVTVAPLVANSIIVGCLNGFRAFWASAWVQVSGPLAYAIGVAMIAVGGSPTSLSILLSWTASSYASLLLGGISLRKVLNRNPQTDSTAPTASQIGKRGVKSLISTYSPLETFRLDQVAVATLLNTTAYGLYSVALAFSNLSKLIGQAMSVDLASQRVTSPRSHAKRTLRLVAISISLGLASATVLPFFIPLLFGPEFKSARVTTLILCTAGALMAARKILNESLRALKKESHATFAEIGGVALFLALIAANLNSLTINQVAIALAVSTMLSVILMTVTLQAITRRGLRTNIPRTASPETPSVDA